MIMSLSARNSFQTGLCFLHVISPSVCHVCIVLRVTLPQLFVVRDVWPTCISFILLGRSASYSDSIINYFIFQNACKYCSCAYILQILFYIIQKPPILDCILSIYPFNSSLGPKSAVVPNSRKCIYFCNAHNILYNNNMNLVRDTKIIAPYCIYYFQ